MITFMHKLFTLYINLQCYLSVCYGDWKTNISVIKRPGANSVNVSWTSNPAERVGYVLLLFGIDNNDQSILVSIIITLHLRIGRELFSFILLFHRLAMYLVD